VVTLEKVMEWLILIEEKETGRWLGEVPALPGVMAYGQSKTEAKDATLALMRSVVLDRLGHDEIVPEFLREVVASSAAKKKATSRSDR
jgi:predicted RNase H-like HicB family nuclease